MSIRSIKGSDLREELLGHRLHLITGKGGVGKSVISVSLALLLKKGGKRVLFAQMSPIETDSKGKDELYNRIKKEIEPLDYIYIEPRSALEEYALMVLRFKRLYKLIFEDRVVRSSIKAIPSLSFLLIIGKLWYYCTLKDKKGRYIYDYVVVDAPSTGMAISMLNLPHIINEAAPPGPLREKAIDIEKMLTDKETTAVHIVTNCEETPVNEAIELYKVISGRLSIRFGLLFVNQFELIERGDMEYISSHIDLLPANIRNCLMRRIEENQYKRGEYERLLSNIKERDRRVINIPLFENNFETSSIVKGIKRYLEVLSEQRDQKNR